jgi:2-keto-myo-inositol isomerase
MLNQTISRREALQLMGVTAGVSIIQKAEASMPKLKAKEKSPFIFSLNMATIRGHKLGFVKELETASAAGFHAVEIWIDTFYEYLANGGTVADTKKRLNDLGIKIENSISFNEWVVDDDAARKKGIEGMKKEMGILAELGCKRIAATGKGVPNSTAPDLNTIADRYRTVLELGDSTGVVPILEMWGFMKNMSNVSEVLYSAMKTGHPSARLLLDVYHLYKGNTSLDTLPLMAPSATEILHMNDIPAGFSSEIVTDADRVYPGDGVAPIKRILQILGKRDKPLVLSTEVFNKVYYSQDALLVAKTALSKMKAVTEGL